MLQSSADGLPQTLRGRLRCVFHKVHYGKGSGGFKRGERTPGIIISEPVPSSFNCLYSWDRYSQGYIIIVAIIAAFVSESLPFPALSPVQGPAWHKGSRQ